MRARRALGLAGQRGEVVARMRLEGQHAAAARRGARASLSQQRQHRLVAAVHAVEIADRQRAGARCRDGGSRGRPAWRRLSAAAGTQGQEPALVRAVAHARPCAKSTRGKPHGASPPVTSEVRYLRLPHLRVRWRPEREERDLLPWRSRTEHVHHDLQLHFRCPVRLLHPQPREQARGRARRAPRCVREISRRNSRSKGRSCWRSSNRSSVPRKAS